MSYQLQAPASLFPRKEIAPWYSLCRRLGGPQSRSGRDGEDKKSNPFTLPASNRTPVIQPLV